MARLRGVYKNELALKLKEELNKLQIEAKHEELIEAGKKHA